MKIRLLWFLLGCAGLAAALGMIGRYLLTPAESHPSFSSTMWSWNCSVEMRWHKRGSDVKLTYAVFIANGTSTSASARGYGEIPSPGDQTFEFTHDVFYYRGARIEPDLESPVYLLGQDYVLRKVSLSEEHLRSLDFFDSDPGKTAQLLGRSSALREVIGPLLAHEASLHDDAIKERSATRPE